MTPQQRKRHLLRTALKLIEERGYVQFNFRELSAEAKVSIGSLYRLFPTKEHLLTTLWGEHIQRMHESYQVFENFGLTDKEQIICSACWPFLRQKLSARSFVIEMIGANHQMFDELSDQSKAELEAQFNAVLQKRFNQFARAVKSGALNPDDGKIRTAIKQLTLISRGAVMIQQHVFVPPSTFQLAEIIEACDLILSQLEWRSDASRVDARRIELALRTTCDVAAQQTD